MTKRNQNLDDLLGDPMVQMVMARDGWHQDQVRMLVERAVPLSDETLAPVSHVIASECLRLRDWCSAR